MIYVIGFLQSYYKKDKFKVEHKILAELSRQNSEFAVFMANEEYKTKKYYDVAVYDKDRDEWTYSAREFYEDRVMEDIITNAVFMYRDLTLRNEIPEKLEKECIKYSKTKEIQEMYEQLTRTSDRDEREALKVAISGKMVCNLIEKFGR